MPSETLAKRRQKPKPGSSEFGKRSAQHAANLIKGFPLLEDGQVIIVRDFPFKRKKAGKPPPGAKKLTTQRDKELQRDKLKNE